MDAMKFIFLNNNTQLSRINSYCSQFRKLPAGALMEQKVNESQIYPLRPNSDLSQTSHWNIKGLSVSEVMRIENVITQVKFY